MNSKRLSKQELVNIFNDTMKYALEISSQFYESEKINIYNLCIKRIPVKNYSPIIEVINQHIIKTILLTEDSKVLVLNLASHHNPGGGVKSGAMSQEEELSRCSDYMSHSNNNSYNPLYPMSRNEIIFTPNIKVIKDENYNKLELHKIKEFDMLAVAAIRNPRLINNRLSTFDGDITFKKIEAIFKFAIIHNYEVLILGALGCEAYHNPPEEIISIFNDCIIKYSNNFRKIIFSIYSIRDNNYEKFNNYILTSI